MFSCTIVVVCGLLLSCVALPVGIYISYKGIIALYFDETNKMILFFKVLFIAFIVSYDLLIISAFSVIPYMCTDISLYDNLSRIAVFFYYCMILPILLITFTARLQLIFEGTAYEIKLRVIRFIYLMIAIITFCNFVYFGISVDYYAGFSENNVLLIQFGRILILCSYTLYLTVALLLVSNFVRKLNQLIFDQHSTPTCDGSNVHLSDVQSGLIAIVSKYVVLSTFAFGTDILALMVYYVFIGILPFSDSTENAAVSQYIGCIDILCNTVCLYLQFRFASDDYKLFCGCCGNMCNRRMERAMVRKIGTGFHVPSNSERTENNENGYQFDV